MTVLKFSFKIILQLVFVIIFFSTLYAKNPEKFNQGNHISNYFSGILLLNDNQYEKSYKYLKELDGLEENHITYSSKYLSSLVNSGRLSEAFKYSKQLEKKKLGNFESELIIGIYYLKNNNYDLAQRYFLKIKKRKSRVLINNFISSSLVNWISFKDTDLETAKNMINDMDSSFENLKSIQNIFLHSYYESKKSEYYFENLTSNDKIDFSRYNYFYAKYLSFKGNDEKAKKVVNFSIKQHPRNLLLKQYKLDLHSDKEQNNFDFQNLSHVIAEILYIIANALSSQDDFNSSNFYLNLSKYLNKNFHPFDLLLAENFYRIGNFKKAKKIYDRIGRKGEAYYWFSTKQNSRILIEDGKKEKALTTISNAFEKLSEKSIYIKFDYARFLKNNDQYESSIELYTEIIQKIKKDHPLYPKSTDGRGVAYERIGDWDKAEKDLLSSLDAKPNQAYVINYLAYSWIEKGIKIDQSLKMLKKAHNLEINDPYIIDSLGWALFKLKRYEESKKYLQLAVIIMPADPTINDHFGDVLWKQGKKTQARYYWNYVLGLDDAEEDLKNKIKDKLMLGI